MDLMKSCKGAGVALLTIGLLVTVSACQKQEGPAERAGKDIDRATQKVGQQIEKAGSNIQDAAKGERK